LSERGVEREREREREREIDRGVDVLEGRQNDREGSRAKME
jgi:hypothetical protein